MTSRHAHRVEVLVAGRSVEAPAIRHKPAMFQSELAEARATFGSARCQCQVPPLQLVIREREGRLFLAAWPKEAEKHALDCPFYSEHASTTGATAYAPSAIDERGDHTAITLAHPLNHHAHSAGAQRRPARAPSSPKPHLNGWGLLHHLWASAAMNRWHPGWHRDWGFVRHALRKAAQSTTVNGQPLLERLYIPPVYVPERAAQTQEHWRDFCEPLYRKHRGGPEVAAGFVIGVVRELEPTSLGYAIKLQHHFERFFLDRHVGENLARFSKPGWSLLQRRSEHKDDACKGHVVASLRVQSTAKRKLVVVEGALMRVSSRFIPVNSSYEDELASLLVAENRAFVRPLTYDNHTVPLPHFILSDVGETQAARIAMYVYGPLQRDSRDLTLAQDRRAAESAGLGYWAWERERSGAPPPLPPPRNRAVQSAPATRTQIQEPS